MLAIISSFVILLFFIYFNSKFKSRNISLTGLFSFFLKDIKRSFNFDKSEKSSIKILSKIKLLTLYTAFLLFIVMFITSFIPTTFTGEHLSGIFLIIHVTFAPLFAVTLVFLLIFYSYQLKFDHSDYEQLRDLNKVNTSKYFSIIKITFWSLAIVSIPLLMSIILILYPLLGTETQNLNIIIHRISAILFTLLVQILIYFSALTKENA